MSIKVSRKKEVRKPCCVCGNEATHTCECGQKHHACGNDIARCRNCGCILTPRCDAVSDGDKGILCMSCSGKSNSNASLVLFASVDETNRVRQDAEEGWDEFLKGNAAFVRGSPKLS